MPQSTLLKPGLPLYRNTWLWRTLASLGLMTAAWLLVGPLPQDLDYHQFADQRTLGPIPHGLNVLSNLPFCLVGFWGLWVVVQRRDQLKSLTGAYLAFAAGIALTGLGSSWYHLAPDNASLVWDRLPMTIAFMAFVAIVVGERVDVTLGSRLLPWLLFVGVASVAYWAWANDLRFYALVQFGPMVALPLLILRTRGPGTIWLWLTIACYALAKVLELGDIALLDWTWEAISSHSLKHLVAAVGAAMMVMKIRRQ